VATPVGHIVAGGIVARLVRANGPVRPGIPGFGWWCAFAAVAADLDFIPGLLLGHPARFHQGASHSFAAALLTSGALALAITRGRGKPWLPWLALFLAYSSHLALDLLGPDRRTPYGIPLAWPFSSETYLSPVTLLPGVRHAVQTDAATGDWLARTLHVRNVVAVLWELAMLAPLAVLAELAARRRRAGGKPG
jgi:membrane-bound metal-dependent hydrolase YbcI (DUF457 family)